MARCTLRNLHKFALMGVLALAFCAASAGGFAADDALYSSLTQGIQSLGEVDTSQAVNQLARYRIHEDNRSRLDRRSRRDETRTDRLSVKAQRILVHNLDPRFDGRREPEADIDVMSTMTPGKALAVITALEDDKNFNGAALLAGKFVDRQLDADLHDLFCLIAARNIWLSRNKQLRDRYEELINAARESKNEQITAEARLWIMAVKAPGSYDAICLSQQIWETLFYDLGDRNRSFYMSHLIGTVGPQVIDRLMHDEHDEEFKQIQVAEIASYISEAGYQTQEGAWSMYAEDLVENMIYPDPEDLAAISFYHGMYFLSINGYKEAAEKFEKVFVSEAAADIEFEAGYRLATCQYEQRDLINAKATLNVLQEWFPDNSRIDQIIKFDRYLEPQLSENSSRLVSERVDQIFSRKMAILGKVTPINTAEAVSTDTEG